MIIIPHGRKFVSDGPNCGTFYRQQPPENKIHDSKSASYPSHPTANLINRSCHQPTYPPLDAYCQAMPNAAYPSSHGQTHRTKQANTVTPSPVSGRYGIGPYILAIISATSYPNQKCQPQNVSQLNQHLPTEPNSRNSR